MKQMSIYLHDEIIKTLECFGEISKVVNDILSFAASSDFDLLGSAFVYSTPNKNKARRINVRIDEEKLQLICPVKLRPLVYWFVENELYSDLNWKPVRGYGSKDKERVIRLFDKVQSDVSRLNVLCNNGLDEVISLLETKRSEYEI